MCTRESQENYLFHDVMTVQPVYCMWPLYALVLPRLLHSQTDYIKLLNLFTHGHNFVVEYCTHSSTKPCIRSLSAYKMNQRLLLKPCLNESYVWCDQKDYATVLERPVCTKSRDYTCCGHTSCITGLLLWKPLVDSCYKDQVMMRLMTSLSLGLLSLWPTSGLNRDVTVMCIWSSATRLYSKNPCAWLPWHWSSRGQLAFCNPWGRVGSKFNWPSEDQCQRSHSKWVFVFIPHLTRTTFEIVNTLDLSAPHKIEFKKKPSPTW